MFQNLDDPRLAKTLEKIWKGLDELHRLTGMEYDVEEDRVIMVNVEDDQTEEYDNMEELLMSISTLYADLSFYLDKEPYSYDAEEEAEHSEEDDKELD